ncbi:unnamed protein product [Orchesella dallaii]|uniref:Envelope fusion protein n=1 Tax=Orchesella dallaii TaxID=48710 RepID=A0ABP1PX55_9HEXA
MDIPDINNDFMEKYNCPNNDETCKFYHHIKSLATSTIQILENGLPQAFDFDTPVIRRKARALDFISSAFNFCCGFAQEVEIQDLTKNQKDTATMIDQMKQQISTEHDAAIRSTTLINKYTNEMEKYLHEEEVRFMTNLIDYRNATVALGKHVDRIEQLISLQAKVQHRTTIAIQMLKVLSDCRSFRIPHSIISQLQLRKELEALKNDLLTHEQKLAIDSSNSQAYYFLETTKCYFVKNTLKVLVNIPVLEKENTYEIFSVNTLPFSYKGSICTVQLNTDYIARKNNEEIIALQGQTKERCIAPHSELCHIPRYRKNEVHNQACIIATLSTESSVASLKNACSFICSKAENKTAIYQIEENTYGIIQPYNDIVISCSNITKAKKPVDDIHIGLHIINLPCSCTAKIGKSTIKSPYPCQSKYEDIEPKITHTIPAHWSLQLEGAVLSDSTYYSNISNIINHNWKHEIPLLNLTQPALAEYTLPIHIESGSWLSYFLCAAIIFIIIAIYVSFKKISAISIEGILTSLLSMIMTRPRAVQTAPIHTNENNITTYLIMEIINDFLLLSIFILLAFTLLKVKQASNKFTLDKKGRIQNKTIKNKAIKTEGSPEVILARILNATIPHRVAADTTQ